LPILDLEPRYLSQQCANCGATRRLSPPSLDAENGSGIEITEDPFVLALPPCASCHAREFLIRSRVEGPGDALPHQQLVNRIFAALRHDDGAGHPLAVSPAQPQEEHERDCSVC